jgi:hypothetical protein
MIKTTILATILALALPYAVTAQTVETEEYENYQVSCKTEAACKDFGVTYEEADQKVAQVERERTRRTRDIGGSNRLFQDYYVGASAGILFGDGLDLGFQGSVFGGTWYNEFIGADLEFTFGFASVDDVDNPFGDDIEIDDNVTILGLFLNPRFQYTFEDSNITAFVSPGIGWVDLDGESELGFQVKAGAEYPVGENLDAFAQGRFQTEGDIFGIEGGVIYDLSS